MSAAAGVLPPALTKEIRALFPTYAAALGSIMVGCVSSSYLLIPLGLLGFAFGSVALGAQSFGLEYAHRTLGLLLSQPIDRRRVFFYKLAVLTVMLVTLTVAILVLYDDLLRRAPSPHTGPSMLMLAAACGLFVAPTLTMLCRSTLAGIVFTIAIPGLLSLSADVVGALVYGLENAAAIDRFRLLVFWRGMLVICVLGALAGWRMFMRLEVIEGHAHVQFPETLRASPSAAVPARLHWAWALVTKELRVQQMTFLVAILFACLWTGLVWLGWSRTGGLPVFLHPVTLLYAALLAMLIGSLSSAEERHFGTLEWQILQPTPAWQQWAIKVGVALGLVLALGVGLPLALGRLAPFAGRISGREAQQIALALVLLTSGAIYVSTLCRSGVAALVWSFASVAGTIAFVRMLLDTADRLVIRPLVVSGVRLAVTWEVALIVASGIGAGLVGVLLILGFVNHRSLERSSSRTWRQVLWIAGYLVVGVAMFLTLTML
jgi:hypothetical protein